MTKLTRLSVFFAALIAVGSSANAGVIAFDDFDYPDGSLVPNGGWANHSGLAGDLMVSGGQVVVQHGLPSEDANLAFTPVSGNVFYGISFCVDASGPIAGGNYEYFAHFKGAGFDYSARLDVVEANIPGGDFTVGIASDEGTADAIWPTDLSFDTCYRAVVRYDQDANMAELWINAAVSSDLSILGEDRADPGDTVRSFALRESDSSLNERILVDGLVIGTTFDDVVGNVPEPSTAPFLLMGITGMLSIRRRTR